MYPINRIRLKVSARRNRIFLLAVLLLLLMVEISPAQPRNILYINSYHISYSWGDSVSYGIQKVFARHKDYNLFCEYLDAKRFGMENFESQFQQLKQKYLRTNFDAVILSDNAALDFMLRYGDSLVPDIPVAFCGINNPEDYNLEGTRFYGIKEGVDQDSVIYLVCQLMPDLNKIYFITDSTQTSLVNLKYIKSLEPKYADRAQFIYITNISIDSLYKLGPELEVGNAIALMDIFQDLDGTPVNSDLVMQNFAAIASVPIFMDSETSFGKGILGGIINIGSAHGEQIANLAVRLAEDPDFVPDVRVDITHDKYYFDYSIAKKYKLNPKLFPVSAHIINKPQSIFIKYLKLTLIFLALIIFLLTIISVLVVNVNRRKKAEEIVRQKLLEIQDQNARLEEANSAVNEANDRLEIINTTLTKVNKDLEAAREKAEEANTLKSAFLANMSHEIRTPLNSIVGFSSILGDIQSEDDRERYVRLITSNSEQLLGLIDDILDISKVETGEFEIHPEAFNASEMLREIIASFSHNLTGGKVKLQMTKTAHQQELSVYTDPLRFRQVLINLISNAIKFTEEGLIELDYRLRNDNTIVFSVRDTGIGISPSFHSKIFDRFWKGEEGAKKFHPGAGLGLAITKHLLEAMGGEIWLESEPNKGSIFYFSLPNTNSASSLEKKDKKGNRDVHSSLPEGLRIAIAEDNENNMEYLLKILSEYNISVFKFHDGKEIVDFFVDEHEKVDIVLMDLKMPRLNGYDASNLIKSMFPDLPIIAQTAYAMKEDIQKIRQSDIDDYIIKPIQADQLILKIKQNLQVEQH